MNSAQKAIKRAVSNAYKQNSPINQQLFAIEILQGLPESDLLQDPGIKVVVNMQSVLPDRLTNDQVFQSLEVDSLSEIFTRINQTVSFDKVIKIVRESEEKYNEAYPHNKQNRTEEIIPMVLDSVLGEEILKSQLKAIQYDKGMLALAQNLSKDGIMREFGEKEAERIWALHEENKTLEEGAHYQKLQIQEGFVQQALDLESKESNLVLMQDYARSHDMAM